MAEAEASGSQKNAMEFLKQKVGPLPMWVWLAAGAVIILYIREKQSGGSLSSLFGGSTGSATPNQQTDPAGNIGTIDPATGYVYGTPEDSAALAANNGSGTATSTTSPAAPTYADNNSWARAAINYLVGLGIDPTQANEAIQQYLASQTLTVQQQADVNQAIQALGPPPDLPGATGTPPGSVITTGTGAMVAVPNVVGNNYEASAKAITAAGLVVSPSSTNGQASGIAGGGWVNPTKSQSPAAGTQVASGSTVTITSSSTTTVNPGGTNTGTSTGTSTGTGTKSPGTVNGQPGQTFYYTSASQPAAAPSAKNVKTPVRTPTVQPGGTNVATK